MAGDQPRGGDFRLAGAARPTANGEGGGAGAPNVVDVRIWERAGGVFVERVAVAGSEPAEPIPEETKTALRSGVNSKVVTEQRSGNDNTYYRVFAPTRKPGEHGRVSGAVEVAERLEG